MLEATRNLTERAALLALATSGLRRAELLGLTWNDADLLNRRLRIHGLGNFTVAEQTVTMTGSPEWIYIQRARAGGACTVGRSTTEPTSGDAIRVPIARYVKQGSLYRLDYPCLLWDVNMGAPTP